jgi:NADH-quinone oxidoreductase subunit K
MNSLSLFHCLALSTIIFSIAIVGIFNKKNNIISILMSIELMLLAINLNFVAFASFKNQLTGVIFSLLIFSINAAEIAIGLALFIVYFKHKNSILVMDIN